ncbi:ester cyclase [Caballeronia sordidicola]|uniref:ester cyclase n=1 Tax=Caballeronia sordidicola TaxID=196367 RepID=UPI000B785A1F|nr:ester cyclase [Caballeronia sordidicola]
MMNPEERLTSLLSRRKLLINGTIATAGLGLVGIARAQGATGGTQAWKASDSSITLRIYKGFSQNRLDLWDAVIHPDVKSNSTAGRNIDGIAALKRWNQSFIDAFRPRTDLIDHFVAGDRGLVTINLHWKHDRPFNGLAPTGKTGTSVENFILRIENGLVTRWDVADASLDLAIYLHDGGLKMPTFVEPPSLIKGVALPT